MDIFDEIHTAGEQVKYLDCRGEKGRARNNKQTEKKNNNQMLVVAGLKSLATR